jgi:hypothetical protein
LGEWRLFAPSFERGDNSRTYREKKEMPVFWPVGAKEDGEKERVCVFRSLVLANEKPGKHGKNP